jgi:hypothetical protein
MKNKLKLISMIVKSFFLFQVQDEYKNNFNANDKPVILKRRTIGIATVIIGTISSIMAIPEVTNEAVKDHVIKLFNAGVEIKDVLLNVKSSLLFFWGIIIFAFGWIRKNK